MHQQQQQFPTPPCPDVSFVPNMSPTPIFSLRRVDNPRIQCPVNEMKNLQNNSAIRENSEGVLSQDRLNLNGMVDPPIECLCSDQGSNHTYEIVMDGSVPAFLKDVEKPILIQSPIAELLDSTSPTPPDNTTFRNELASSRLKRFERLVRYMEDFCNLKMIDECLLQLSRLHQVVPNFARVLWENETFIWNLITEMTKLCQALDPEISTVRLSRLCNITKILRSFASDPYTRGKFMVTIFPTLLHLVMEKSIKSEEFENVRYMCLSVVRRMLKFDCGPEDEDLVTKYFTDRQINGWLLVLVLDGKVSKLLALVVLHAYLQTENGFRYVCLSDERHDRIHAALGKVTNQEGEPESDISSIVSKCFDLLKKVVDEREQVREQINRGDGAQ